MSVSSSLSLLKKKQQQKLNVPDTILVKKLKNLSTQSDLLVFKDVNIYHHTATYTIPLMVLDTSRGLYLFETREWTYGELKNTTIQKAQNQDSSNETLAFDNHQSIIRQKFNELTHSDGIPIFNYLLMANLNADEYLLLDESFKELLPLEKVIFSDSLESDILQKLQDSTQAQSGLCTSNEILTTLLIQYTIFDINNKLHFCTKEQISFIDKELETITHLNGVSASGKSSSLLLKSIVELLKNSSQKIIILKPTILACNILKNKLLDIVEHAIIDIDMTAIEIITPLTLLNRHQIELQRDKLSSLSIDSQLMKKSFDIANIIMCDDAQTYDSNLIDYLKHIQKKSKLLLVNSDNDSTFDFKTNFRESNKEIFFYQTTPHIKALHLVSKLLKEDKKITVVSNSISAQKLKDDLFRFIEVEPHSLDSSTLLINQNTHQLTFSAYKDLNEFQTNHIILMDLCFTSINEIEYALNLSDISVHILYEEDCQEIKQLRSKYE